jgi:hypothetical protein
VQPQYYYYKQLTRAGQKGMAVAKVNVADSSPVQLIAFASNGSENPDAFVVLNLSEEVQKVELSVKSNTAKSYKAFRSSSTEQYKEAGTFSIQDGKLLYNCPSGSVTTFIGQ